MIRLEHSLQAWPSPGFEATVKKELLAVAGHSLPLQQGLRQGSHALEGTVAPVLLGAEQHGDVIRLRLGLHYQSIIAGCSCADDPTPQDTLSEYCVIQLDIDRATAAATIRLLEEE